MQKIAKNQRKMNKSILIIDDQESQALALYDALKETLGDCSIEYTWEENDMMAKIITRYYSVAIVDLRMEHYNIDGFSVMDQIMIANPYATISTTPFSANSGDTSSWNAKTDQNWGLTKTTSFCSTPNMLDEFKEIIDRQVA